MANPKHFNQFIKGPLQWNEWRSENPKLKPDLSDGNFRDLIFENVDLNNANLRGATLPKADLTKSTLIGANLTYANLTHANLQGVNLSASMLRSTNFQNAYLQGADLTATAATNANFAKANLSCARLQSADLSHADLKGAVIVGAKLVGANLTNANFTAANLSKSNLQDAILAETVFGNTNLMNTKGLAICRHAGPCVIDHRTIQQTGTLPKEFLRGCGLADWQIEHVKLLNPNLRAEEINDITYEIFRFRAERHIQLFSPFISYCSNDQGFADKLYNALQNSGVRCWYAPEDIKIGDKIRPRIDEAIHLHDKLLLILSEESIKSDWVEDEVEIAFEKERKQQSTVLFPIRIDDAVDKSDIAWVSKIQRTRHIGDFSNWQDPKSFQSSLARVLRDLRAKKKSN